MSLGQAINALAEERKITKYRISKNSGISQTTLGEIANGKNLNPTIDTIEKIAKGLGVAASELMKRAEEMEEK